MMTGKTHSAHRTCRDRGAAAVLAMMFLVIFSSLAAAMAIVSQGNLTTAESSMKINRSLAASETGMKFMIYRLNQVTQGDATAGTNGITTREGVINAALANTLWNDARTQLLNLLAGDFQYQQGNAPYVAGGVLVVPEIPVGPGQPSFSATFEPHPLANENYDAAFYQQPPFSDQNPPASNLSPLDARWVRITVTASDGPIGSRIYRSVSMDFKIDKKIRYALLSKSRIMIGRNVMIDGPVGSSFLETNLANGHPIQMESDFRGLDANLDADLDLFRNTLISNDANGDNRINLASSAEIDQIANPSSFDYDQDGYIDDYDFFMAAFDANADLQVSLAELDPGSADFSRQQLMSLIDTFGDPSRQGYGDGLINEYDRYTKLRGEVYITASKLSWEDGAADPDGPGGATGAYQDYFQGPIVADFGNDPMTFDADNDAVHQFNPSDFDVASFAAMASGDLVTQAASQGGSSGTTSPAEAVPFGAAHPYEYYDRPIYQDMQFDNITIPAGTNALFINCTFIGVTYVDTAVDNIDPNFNYAGMIEADGTQKHPGRTAMVNGVEITDTKTVSNNLRFDNCTFEGSVVTQSPNEFTHVRNKLSFTGTTRFLIDESTHLSASEKDLFRRSTLLAPHFSVEMGTFIAPEDAGETVELSGTIVTGVLDMRGQVKIIGSLLTTFEPVSNTGPVIGDTSPQFNTTLGYFSSSSGDLESELPTTGVGVIQVMYDPTIPLPDGILGNIEIAPSLATYREGGQ